MPAPPSQGSCEHMGRRCIKGAWDRRPLWEKLLGQGMPASHRRGSDRSKVACDSLQNRDGSGHPPTPLPISFVFIKAPGKCCRWKAPEKEDAWSGTSSAPCCVPSPEALEVLCSWVLHSPPPPGPCSLSHLNPPYSHLPRGPGPGRLRAGPKLTGTHPRRPWPGGPSLPASDLASVPAPGSHSDPTFPLMKIQ